MTKLHVIGILTCIVTLRQCVFSMTKWSRVEMSTCYVPMEDWRTFLCCYTHNIPKQASIYFYVKSAGQKYRIFHRIKKGCVADFSFEHPNFDVISSRCDVKGEQTTYSIDLSYTYKESAGMDWKCGFYGNHSEFTLTKNQVLTDYLGDVMFELTNKIVLNWSILPDSQIPGFRIPSYSQISGFEIHEPDGDKIVEFDKSSNDTFVKPGFELIGDISTGNVSIAITRASPQSNGTYVCIYLDPVKGVVRSGVTLVILGSPTTPVLTANKSAVVSTGVVSGWIYCYSSSTSAAPLYYKPQIQYRWLVPTELDDPNFTNISTNGSSLFLPHINCGALTSLPVYCQSAEGSVSSFISPPGNLSLICNIPENATDTPSPVYNQLTTVLVASLFSTAFVLVSIVSITVVIRRKALLKKMRRCCRLTCRCSACCRRMSESDSDSDLERAIDESRSESDSRRRDRHRERRQLPNILGDNEDDNNRQISLGDGLANRQHDREVQAALERIAIEESLHFQQRRERSTSQETELSSLGGENLGFIPEIDDGNLSNIEGAVGGMLEPSQNPQDTQGGFTIYKRQRSEQDDADAFKAVERLLEQHNRHLDRHAMQVVVNRATIVQDVLECYTDSKLAVSRVSVKMIGEHGMDCGGVSDDMYTTFWSTVQDQYFSGYEAVVPHLPMNRWMAEEKQYRVLGRILSHTIALTKALPLPLCKSAIIAMIFDTIEVDMHSVVQDFLFYLDPIDRQLFTTGINNFSSLSHDQIQEMQDIFTRFEYPAVIKEQSFREHVTQLARTTVCIKPKPLLSLMREGIPESHLQYFWGMLNVNYLEIMFLALKPSPERIVARLKTDPAEDGLNQRQKRAFRYLQDFIKELSQPEVETFLHFLTGKKTTPRQAIVVTFTHERGFQRAPRAHTCSNLLELPDTYEDYPTFKSEFKHLLAASEAMTMTMA